MFGVESRWMMITNVVVFQGTLAVIGSLFVLDPDASTVSEEENRALAEMPRLTWDGLYGGKYTDGIEAYVADHFPYRERFLAVSDWLRENRGLAVESGVHYAMEVNEGTLEEQWSDEDDPDPNDEDLLGTRIAEEPAPAELEPDETAQKNTRAGIPDELPEDAPEVPGGTLLAGPTPPDGPNGTKKGATLEKKPGRAHVRAGIFIYEGRAMQGFAASQNGAPTYIKMMNAYEQEIGKVVDIYALIVPSPQEFYLPDKYRRKSGREKPNIYGTYKRLLPGIKTVDAYAELAAHTDENIYFRTDHHWTGLGGYYAYRAFCKAAKLEPVPLSRMAKHTPRRDYYGSLYRLTHDPGLRKHGDRVEYYVPPAAAKVTKHDRNGKGKGAKAELFNHKSYGYGVFLGGDAPMLRVETDVKNGKRAIVVKNSYGNAFVVYLVSHYQDLVFLDYRYFHGRMIDVLEESDQDTDLIFVNGTHTANTRSHVKRVGRMLYGKWGKPRAGKPAEEPLEEKGDQVKPDVPGTVE